MNETSDDATHIVPALCLLLAGGPRPAPLVVESGCSILDLSPYPNRTVMGVWIERLAELCPLGSTIDVKVIHDGQTHEPILETDPGPLTVEIRQDRRRYRGPIGIAKDECHGLDPDALILLAEANRIPSCSLARMIEDHNEHRSDITVGVNADHSPAGVFVFHRSALDLVPDRGFMDLKEQWLPKALAAGLKIDVCDLQQPGLMSIRSRELFLHAARQLNGLPDPLEGVLAPLSSHEQQGSVQRCVVAKTAIIAMDAVVFDSVIMEHATVGAGALVARSLVCPRCVVGPDQTVVDAVFGRGGLHFADT